jgi:hypothetical protein
LPPNASTFYWRQTAANELFAASLKKTPHSDSKTAPAQTPIDNNKKTPTSDNVGTPAAPLPPKPPCNCMCPLEQSTSGTSQPAWTPEAIDDSAASKPPTKQKTPHSDTKTAPAQTTIDNDNNTTPTSDSVSALAAASSPARTFGILRVPKPPTKQKTPHSDTKTAPAQTIIDNDNNTTPTSDNVSALG